MGIRIEQLRLVDEPRVLLEMQAWERTHPRSETTAGV
jgi:hypothetical protein